jgi:hypothetical protein
MQRIGACLIRCILLIRVLLIRVLRAGATGKVVLDKEFVVDELGGES